MPGQDGQDGRLDRRGMLRASAAAAAGAWVAPAVVSRAAVGAAGSPPPPPPPPGPSIPDIGNDASSRPATDSFSNFVFVDANNPAQGDGTITEFDFYVSVANRPFKFLVVSSGNVVEWKSPLITPTTTGAQSFTPALPVPVSLGDRVGLYFQAQGAIPWASGGALGGYTGNNSGEPVDGQTLGLTGAARRYSFVARTLP